jgi:hypothetical protein
MKARVIRSFIDKYTMEDIDKGAEIEITEERHSELTAGPQGIFVEEIKEMTSNEPPKEEKLPTDKEPPKEVNEEEPKKEKEKATKKK